MEKKPQTSGMLLPKFLELKWFKLTENNMDVTLYQ